MQTTANIAEGGGDGRMKRQVKGRIMQMRDGTVYDRMKKTGYVMSPNHMMGPAMDDSAAPAEPDADDQEGAPPNLRDSTGPESCGNCAHYDTAGANGGGNCLLYNYDVTPNQVCDSYKPEADEGDGEGGGDQGGGGAPGDDMGTFGGMGPNE